MVMDAASRQLLVDLRSMLTADGMSAAAKNAKAVALIDRFVGIVPKKFLAGAYGRGSFMLVGRSTKWTKFEDAALRFDTREEAWRVLEDRMARWQTARLWTKLVMDDEEFMAFKVMQAIR
jgi:hypothetical protein